MTEETRQKIDKAYADLAEEKAAEQRYSEAVTSLQSARDAEVVAKDAESAAEAKRVSSGREALAALAADLGLAT